MSRLYLREAKEEIWVEKINEARVSCRLCDWITTFHPTQLPYQLFGGFLNGAYNVCQKFTFEDNTTWLLRLPRERNTFPQFADEKVAMEVEALGLIRGKTDIPVPEVGAWGLRGELLKEDIPDEDVEYVYRQVANFMLQLYKINFERIGSLPTPKDEFHSAYMPTDMEGDRTQGFSTPLEYFKYNIRQDMQQLQHQPNSVSGPFHAESVYTSLKILDSLIPKQVHEKYNHGPFKLICNDFRPANLLVKSKDDLTIVGVVDLEWVYAGPAQLFASAPWWLLHDRPVNSAWDFQDDEAPKATSRYFKCLEIFKRVLAEEEAEMPDQNKEVSQVVEWSEASGAMWLHMVLSSGFFDSNSSPCKQFATTCGR